MTKAMETVVTGSTAEAIVTALEGGPCSALALSQRLDGVNHANARQTLHRLAKAGVVTKASRGIYQLRSADCDNPASLPRAAKIAAPRTYSEQEIDRAVEGAWDAFEAMNDPRNPEAWA